MASTLISSVFLSLNGTYELSEEEMNQLWLKANLDKKGRVCGLGSTGVTVRRAYRSSASSSPPRSADVPDMREQVIRLNESLAQQAEENRRLQSELTQVKVAFNSAQNSLCEPQEEV